MVANPNKTLKEDQKIANVSSDNINSKKEKSEVKNECQKINKN